jgi:quercetin 2,3-dioxygenase
VAGLTCSSVRHDGNQRRRAVLAARGVDGDELLAEVAFSIALRTEVHADADEPFHEQQQTERGTESFSEESGGGTVETTEGADVPAITADPTTLPRLAPLDTLRPRRVRSVTTAPSGFEGEGFPVRRAFAGVALDALDPFIHMDQMGAVNYGPYEPRGTDWHPHRGFETVTYILDGTFVHQDSHGGGGTIANGATQWMTAGSGILHIETPPDDLVIRGGLFHGVQLWVNLPSRSKMIAPAYQNLESQLVTLFASPDAGALVRVIAGSLGGFAGPGSTHTPIVVAHATICPGERLELPWPSGYNSLAYALSGSGTIGAEPAPFEQGQLAVLHNGDSVVIVADAAPRDAAAALDVLLLGGEPIREPVAAYGPFVMNTRAELQQAFDDFQAGKLGTVPADGIRPFRGERR